MKGISLLLIIVGQLLLSSVGVVAQVSKVATNRGSTRASKTAKAAKKPARKSRQPATEIDSRTRRLWFSAKLETSFDTNINRDQESLNSAGVVPSMGIHFQNSLEKPTFEIEYEVGLHRYRNTDKWNRTSHNLQASYKHHLFGRWYSRTEGEVSLKGSSEDRELNNQYVLGQQFEYRLNSNNRVQLFAAYRLKRDPLDSGNNAIDPYMGAKFVQKLAGHKRWELSYRYDKNRSWDPRNRYIRWTYGAEFETPVFNRRNHLTFDLTYKPRLYARTVKVNGERVPRRDQRWAFGALFERPLRRDLTMAVLYKYETRDSNDPDKKFNSHQAGLAFTYKW